MKGTCEQIPFHFFLKFMMLCYAGELGMLQLTVKNLLCYNNVGSPTALIKGQRRLSKWIVSKRLIFRYGRKKIPGYFLAAGAP